MTNWQRGRKLVETASHDDGSASLRPVSSHKKVYKRSATLLTVLLCSATFAALDASSTKTQSVTPKIHSVDNGQHVPIQTQAQPHTPASSVSSPGVTNTTNNTSITSNSSTTVTVNGKSVAVPANGSYHQTTSSGDGDTSVNVSHSSSSSSGQNNSSVSINVNSQSGGG
jgi:hypothetical protein